MMDFTNVQDVALSILKATARAIRLNEEKDVRLPGDTQEEHYNIVSGNSTSLMTLARLILKVVHGSEVRGRVIATQSDPMFTDAYSSTYEKAYRILNFRASTKLEDGLRTYVNEIKQEGIRHLQSRIAHECSKDQSRNKKTLAIDFSQRLQIPSPTCKELAKAIEVLEEDFIKINQSTGAEACLNDCGLITKCINTGECKCIEDRCLSKLKGFMDSLEQSQLGYLSPGSQTSVANTAVQSNNKKIVIIGSGPTALCASVRLKELGHQDWKIYEKATSEVSLEEGYLDRTIDKHDFQWDFGSVQTLTSHYRWFDDLLDVAMLNTEWINSRDTRLAYVRRKFIKEPLLYHIKELPKDEAFEILSDLMELKSTANNDLKRNTVSEWALKTYGKSFANKFILPKIEKEWGRKESLMSYSYERIDLRKLGSSLLDLELENKSVRYPSEGNAYLWESIRRLAEISKPEDTSPVASISVKDKQIKFSDKSSVSYDALISTMSLDKLITLVSPDNPRLSALSPQLKENISPITIVGIGFSGKLPKHLEGIKAIEFPESHYPFYRVTVLSNLSPKLAPSNAFSLLVELGGARDTLKQHDMVPKIIELLKNATVIGNQKMVTSIVKEYEYGRPVPFYSGDSVLHDIQAELQSSNIWSRGSFGTWKYEASASVDQLCLQGVEAVDNILFHFPETTINYPERVMSMYRNVLPVGDDVHQLKPTNFYFLEFDFVIARRCSEDVSWLSELIPLLFGSETSLGSFKIFIYEECEDKNVLHDEQLHITRQMISAPDPGFETVAYLTHMKRMKGQPQEGDVSVFLSAKQTDVAELERTIRQLSSPSSTRQHFSYIGGNYINVKCETQEGEHCSSICKIFSSILRREGACPKGLSSYSSAGFYVSKQRLNQVRKPAIIAALDYISQNPKAAQQIGLMWHSIFYEPDRFSPQTNPSSVTSSKED
eukprot:TRINITY_DN2753_c0_g2_i1.p1 TRINITY_DN2753_c0_g2~~TRINITY_DN2753_c0_g2_i1.p1  ORF type:complete len:985 (+),score=156.39 TRINITY_DN2753_c0_g2_i1:123-2957(+)